MELESKSEMLKECQNKLILEQNIKDNLQKELNLLKNQMSEYIKDIKNITFEKDNEIANLVQKIKLLHEEKEMIDKMEMSDINEIPQQNTIKGRSRGINTNVKRGLKPGYSAGIRPT